MRITSFILAALALGACDPPEESVATQTVVVPLRYAASLWLRASDGSSSAVPGSLPKADTATAAYTAALAQLDQRCASNSLPRHECLGRHEIQLVPYIWEATTEPTSVYGYAATFNRYVEGVNAVRSMFTSRTDARATDFKLSMTAMQSVLHNLELYGKDALHDRDELVKKAREFPDKLTKAGEALYGEEYGRLLRKQQKIRESQAIIEKYRRAIADQQAEYDAVAAQYRTFHNAEPVDQLNSLATRASAATLSEFVGLQQELMALLSAENSTPQDLDLRAARLQGFFESQQRWFDAEIDSYRPFLAEEGAVAPDLTSRPIEVLEGMRRYLADRQQRMNAAAGKLIDGMKRRKSALVLLERDAQTRATIGDATRARAAADFLDQATAQITATWAAQPSAAGIELLGARYQGVLALLQTAQLCSDADAPDWMHDGCGSYATNVSKANLYLQNALPSKLRRDAIKARSAGAPEAEVAALEAAVNANDLARAVLLHDNLAHHMETTP